MDEFQIETAQNVTISQNVAHVSTRIGSFLIDLLIIGAYYLAIILIFNAIDADPFESWAIMSLFALPVFFYSLFFEVILNGQTPGKAANKIRVVNLNGSKPTFGGYLLRWMLRLIDISMASGSIALLTILLNGKGQRLGDLAAGTTVISEKKRINLTSTLAIDIPDDYVPTYVQVTTLTDTDMQTIKNLYYTAKKDGDHAVILKLHIKIIKILEIQTQDKPFDFVNTIINDYNYYTQQ